jgi:hypothetical protein
LLSTDLVPLFACQLWRREQALVADRLERQPARRDLEILIPIMVGVDADGGRVADGAPHGLHLGHVLGRVKIVFLLFRGGRFILPQFMVKKLEASISPDRATIRGGKDDPRTLY